MDFVDLILLYSMAVLCGGSVVFPVYRGGKPRCREVKSQKARRDHRHDPNPICLPPKPAVRWQARCGARVASPCPRGFRRLRLRRSLRPVLSESACGPLMGLCVLVCSWHRARGHRGTRSRNPGEAEGGGRLPCGLCQPRASGRAGLPFPVPVHLPEAEVCARPGKESWFSFPRKMGEGFSSLGCWRMHVLPPRCLVPAASSCPSTCQAPC